MNLGVGAKFRTINSDLVEISVDEGKIYVNMRHIVSRSESKDFHVIILSRKVAVPGRDEDSDRFFCSVEEIGSSIAL